MRWHNASYYSHPGQSPFVWKVICFIIINSLGGELHIGRPGVTAPVSISPTLFRMTTRINTERIAEGGVQAEELTQPKSIAFAFPDLFKEMQLQILEIE